MSKKQNRRSVSLRPETYARAITLLGSRAMAATTISRVVEDAINDLCEKHGIPAVGHSTALEILQARETEESARKRALALDQEQERARTRRGADANPPLLSQYFTF